MIPELKISDYDYDLPDGRIAKYPLAERDSSKLLIYNGGKVSHTVFNKLPELVESGSMIIFNDTKVVPARLFFRKPTGAHIELFCLRPVEPSEYVSSFASTGSCVWMCVIGNAKKWKDQILDIYDPDGTMSDISLKARLLSRDAQTGNVEFSWKGGLPFSSVLERCGTVPIPPYLNRETEEIDHERYQTCYAKYRGSVAAPTAGLHFTEKVLSELKEKGVEEQTVCLHVGAGTFLPVKNENVSEHLMHREPFIVKKALIERILDINKNVIAKNKSVISVGTTSVRTLESLYYVGVSILEKGEPEEVAQWAPYERNYPYSTVESLQAIVDWIDRNGRDSVSVTTRIIIVPGFKFRIVDKMITNFHQPKSTLLLLISAFVGGDWKTIYDYAMENDFRFLSYGDSSLLTRR